MKDVLTVSDVAALLDCAETTIEALAQERTLPGIKPGRSRVFPREALLAALNRQALERAAPAPAPSPVPVPQSTKPRRNVPPKLPVLETMR